MARPLRDGLWIAVAAVLLAVTVPEVSRAGGPRWIVATSPAPPFVIERPDGSFGGLSVALWDQVAKQLGVEYELRAYSKEALWDAVAAGEVELAVGALDVTADREERVDFSHPFYRAGLGVASQPQREPGWREDVASLLSWRVVRILGLAMLLLAVAGVLVWLIERRHNRQHFSEGVQGLGDGIWWSAVTMTTVGYGDKAPITPVGRTVALLWMFASLVLIATITGAIASSLTVSHLHTRLDSPAELSRVRVGAVEGSVAATWLDERGIGYEPGHDARAVLDLLVRGKVEAVLHDAPILGYLIAREYAGQARLLPMRVEHEDYAFALPPGSPHREAVSRALIHQVRRGAWADIRRVYLGE